MPNLKHEGSVRIDRFRKVPTFLEILIDRLKTYGVIILLLLLLNAIFNN